MPNGPSSRASFPAALPGPAGIDQPSFDYQELKSGWGNNAAERLAVVAVAVAVDLI
jgi:hypothetical protein